MCVQRVLREELDRHENLHDPEVPLLCSLLFYPRKPKAKKEKSERKRRKQTEKVVEKRIS